MKIISFALFTSISVMGCMNDAGTNPETPIDPQKTVAVYIWIQNIANSYENTSMDGDTLFMPIGSKSATLVIIPVNGLNEYLPLKDPYEWTISSNRIKISDSLTHNTYGYQEGYLVTSDSLLMEQPCASFKVSCMINGIKSNILFVEVIYNATRMHYTTIEYSNGIKIENIRLFQVGDKLDILDANGHFISELWFSNNIFVDKSKFMGDYSMTSTVLDSYDSPLRGVYKSRTTNETGTWLLK
jgi:hypothetical protein